MLIQMPNLCVNCTQRFAERNCVVCVNCRETGARSIEAGKQSVFEGIYAFILIFFGVLCWLIVLGKVIEMMGK